jgi:hypothetical protein
MTELEEIAQIRAYLEKHRAAYDREALRRKLLADGFTADAVDLAMTQVYSSADVPPVARLFGSPLLLYSLIVIGILFVNVLMLPALLKYVYEAQGWWPPWAPPYERILLVAPVEGLLAWMLRRLRAPRWLWQGLYRAVLLYSSTAARVGRCLYSGAPARSVWLTGRHRSSYSF